MTATIILVAVLILALLFIAALARHKKGASGELNLVGARAVVEKELWPARSRTGETLESGSAVLIVGASGHLLEVEREDNRSPKSL